MLVPEPVIAVKGMECSSDMHVVACAHPPLELDSRVCQREHGWRLKRSASLKEGKNEEWAVDGEQNNITKQKKHKLFIILLLCLIKKNE